MKQFVHSAEAAREFDRKTIQELKVPSLILMEHAAMKMTDWILKEYPEDDFLLIFCGPGNNGADGLAMARLLALQGKHPQCVLDEGGRLSEDEKVQLEACRRLGIPVLSPDSFKSVEDIKNGGTLIVDALFGSGLSRDLEGRYADLAILISEAGLPVISVDIPSGINGTTGKGKPHVQADVTLALDCRKLGHVLSEGREASRKVEVLDISIPHWLHEQDPDRVLFIDEQAAAAGLPERSLYRNKGQYGKMLMIGGSSSMQGALSMAGMSCFHAGIGTLTLYTPETAARELASKLDLAMILSAPETEDGFFDEPAADRLPDLLSRYTFAACGNGMGRGKGAMKVLQTVLESDLPLVIDADGISLLQEHADLLIRKTPVILTPHLMEFSRISGFLLSDIEQDPLGCMRSFLKDKPNVILILKSDVTFVADAARTAVLDRPDSALSKGGSGDVLCGIMAGLAAQSSDLFLSCCTAVYIHNQAAASAKSPYTFTPLDLIAHFKDVFCRLDEIRKQTAD